MQITYADGKRETHDDLTPEQLAEHFHRLAGLTDEIVQLHLTRETNDKSSGPYPNNRQGRRRWARELQKR